MDHDTDPRLPLEATLYQVKKTIVGQDGLLERMLVALLARGHLLVEGGPGLAKTMAIKGGSGETDPIIGQSRQFSNSWQGR